MVIFISEFRTVKIHDTHLARVSRARHIVGISTVNLDCAHFFLKCIGCIVTLVLGIKNLGLGYLSNAMMLHGLEYACRCMCLSVRSV